MDALMKLAFENAGPVATGVVLAVFAMVMILKALGFTGVTGDREKLDNGTKLMSEGVAGVKTQLEDIDKRLGAVESDLHNRPTKDDIHRLEISFTRLEGQVLSSAATIQATAVAIGRIEDYMYQAASRKGGVRS